MSNTVQTPGQPPITDWNPPGGDSTLDDLFPGESGAQPTTAQPQAQPAATTQPESFVYTYKTRDEAERGIAHKDALIEYQKRRIAELEASTKAPAQPSTAQPPADNRSYLQRVQDAVKKAVDTGDGSDYENVQREFLFRELGPAIPIFVENAKAVAVQAVEEEIPGFRTFVKSPDFAKVKEVFPDLKVAIDNAEGNLQFVQNLPGLYRIAHAAAAGLKLKELARETPSAPAQAAPAQQPRPTMTSTTQVPPQPAPPADMSSAEGRKRLIEEFERRGIQNLPIR